MKPNVLLIHKEKNTSSGRTKHYCKVKAIIEANKRRNDRGPIFENHLAYRLCIPFVKSKGKGNK